MAEDPPPAASAESSREVRAVYVDPLELVWTTTAQRVGLRLARSSEVFAATDGATLTLGTPETLDADDCVAQMAFHELCHSLVMGPENFHRPDWGMSNTSARDEVYEHACLRLQSALCRPHGLQSVFAPTTDFRAFYDALPLDSLGGPDASAQLARAGFARLDDPPWGPHVSRALEASAVIVRAVRPFAEAPSLFAPRREQ